HLVVELPAAAHAAGTMELMKKVAWVLAITSIGVIIGMFIFRSNIDHIVDLIHFRRVGALLHNFAQGLSFLRVARSFGIVLFSSLVLWVLIALQFWFMMLGMKFQFSFAESSLVM